MGPVLAKIKIFLPNITFNEIEIFTKTADFFIISSKPFPTPRSII